MSRLYNNDIDTVCLEIFERVKKEYPYYTSHLYFLYNYGVRIGELFNYRISIDESGNNISIDAQKNNNTRILPPKDGLTFYYLEKLQASQSLQWINKKNLERIISKLMPIRNLKVGNKNVGAHLFRHNYIKKLIGEGKQYLTIDSIMGYTTQSVSDTYAISKIYY